MPYTPDPHTADAPITTFELEALIAEGGRSLRKPAAAVHLLRRVRITLAHMRDQMQRLHGEMQSANLNAAHGGAPTTLHPLDSLQFLSVEEKRRVMDGYLVSQFDTLTKELASVRATRAALTSMTNSLQFQLAGILDEPSVPQRVKNRTQQLMGEISAALSRDLDLDDPPTSSEQP
jgi:hypothetical protein